MPPDIGRILLLNYAIAFFIASLLCVLAPCTTTGWLVMLGIFPIASTVLVTGLRLLVTGFWRSRA